MGRTYLSIDHETETEVAVKALYPSRLADWKDLELFQREAAILQRLDHPQIPAYIDSFHEGEDEATCYYLVQSYVRGETLRKSIAAQKRFDEEELVTFAKQLLEPISYMHNQDPKVIHRDIKPENILIRDGVPTLVDFGAVREVVRLTMGGGSTVVGSYGYMPPEQLMGKAVPATDLYAVGITLLECLTRRRPGDLSGREALTLIDETSVSARFKRVLKRLCAPALSDRYESVDQVMDDLERVSAGSELVHASKLEKDIVVRKKKAEDALKKASRPAVHVGYVAIITSIAVASVLAIYFVSQALATSFEAGFLMAGLISGVGLLTNLVLAGGRYIIDAWEPPKPSWVEAEGRVDGFSKEVDPNTGQTALMIEYSFPTKSGRSKHKRALYQSSKSSIPKGTTFRVFYPDNNPQIHEILDFRRRDMQEAERLFEPNRIYTPE